MQISDEKLQGYLDGFKAAVDMVASMNMHVTPGPGSNLNGMNDGITLGIRSVEDTLRRQYETFLRGEK